MAKPAFRFCIPVHRSLESEDGWNADNDKKTRFVIFRFHFAAFPRPDPSGTTYFGDAIDTIVFAKDLTVGTEYAKKHSVQRTDAYKTIQNSLVESAILTNLSAKLAAGFKVPAVADFSSELTSQIQASVKTQFSSGIEVSRSVAVTEEISYKQTFAFGHNSKEGEASIYQTYKKVFFDLHLTHVDYLIVDYQRSFLGLRKKRKKSPPLSANGKLVNVKKISLPIVSLGVWKINPSLSVKWKGDTFVTVDDPLEVTTNPPGLAVTPAVDPPGRPTLYQLSNAAFPIRWVKRKGEWKEEDLRQAELDESKNTGWWFQYGSGQQKEAQA